jgi:putative solute:sodium symporter small subunit
MICWRARGGDVEETERPARARAYWRRNLGLVGVLLGLWLLASLGLGVLWVRPLNGFRLGGFPLGFWFAQQGSILVFVLLILAYALAMDRLERRRRDE